MKEVVEDLHWCSSYFWNGSVTLVWYRGKEKAVPLPLPCDMKYQKDHIPVDCWWVQSSRWLNRVCVLWNVAILPLPCCTKVTQSYPHLEKIRMFHFSYFIHCAKEMTRGQGWAFRTGQHNACLQWLIIFYQVNLGRGYFLQENKNIWFHFRKLEKSVRTVFFLLCVFIHCRGELLQWHTSHRLRIQKEDLFQPRLRQKCPERGTM